MTDYELTNIDPEDIEDLLIKIEKSFQIKFVSNELLVLSTFGELCDHITKKIKLENSDDCTKQQAFYKLRKVICSSLDVENIKTNTILSDILPRQNRIKKVRQMERKLGFKLSFLRPKHSIYIALIFISFISFATLIINLEFGLSGLFFSIVGFYIAQKLGKEFDVNTVGELTEKMTRENYLSSRRNPTTINKNEIENILIEWFNKDLDLDKTKLTRDARLV